MSYLGAVTEWSTPDRVVAVAEDILASGILDTPGMNTEAHDYRAELTELCRLHIRVRTTG